MGFGKYLSQIKVIRPKLMEYLGNGTVSTSLRHQGFSYVDYLPFKETLNFLEPFEEVWEVQSKFITLLKVCWFSCVVICIAIVVQT